MNKKPFTDQDRADLLRLTQEIRRELDELKQVPRFIRIGARILEIKARALHEIKGKDLDAWSKAELNMRPRQVRKYERVAEKLSEAETAEWRLCLDKVVVVAVAQPEQRRLLRALGEQGFATSSLSAGRRAGASYLLRARAEEDEAARATLIAKGLEVTEAAARKQQEREERQEAEPASPAPASDEDDADPDDAAPADLLRRIEGALKRQQARLAALREQVERGAVPREEVDLERLTGLRERAQELAAEAGDLGALCAAEPAVADVRAAAADVRSGTVDFRPLTQAIGALSFDSRLNIVMALTRAIAQPEPLPPDDPRLAPLWEELDALPADTPPELVAKFEELVCDADWGRRGAFVLWVSPRARLHIIPSQIRPVEQREDLPPRLRAAFAEHRQAKEEARGPSANP